MSIRFWIGVVAGDHVENAIETGICAFSHGKKASLAKLSDGDRFVYYSPKTGYMAGAPIQCFTALGTVIDPTPFAVTWAGVDIWAAKAAYANVPHTPVRPLLEALAFVANPARWGMAFRRGQFEITEGDFTLIETAMKAQKS